MYSIETVIHVLAGGCFLDGAITLNNMGNRVFLNVQTRMSFTATYHRLQSVRDLAFRILPHQARTVNIDAN